MPTLTRLIFYILCIIALLYAAMLGLVYWVQPQPDEIIIRINQQQLRGE